MFADPAISVAISKAAFSFALMAAIAMACAVFIRALVAMLGVANARLAAQSRPRPAARPVAPAPAAEAQEIEPGVVAAISAAVAACVGAHRVVYIGETQPGAWSAETRLRHHASHNPHYDR